MTLRSKAARVRNALRGHRASPTPARQAEHVSIDDQIAPGGDAPVDVRELLRVYTVEQLAETADDYYRKNLEGIDYYYAKPLTSVDETPDFLICFSQVLAGVRPVPGMRVLDFGAGTGWTTRFLTQLGCETIVCDVSVTALEIAKELFKRQPVAGPQPEPSFLAFDGHHIDLPDESIDRIICIDAFHHVPNPDAVLREFGRVLKPGGIAGFQEPGPNHSKKAQSQLEMKQFTVIENDIVMREIWGWAQDAGFTSLKLAVFTAEHFQTSVEGYEDFLNAGITTHHYYEHLRRFVDDRRIFFLGKGDVAVADSRERRGLVAELAVTPDSTTVAAGGSVTGTVRAKNTGTNVWLSSDAPLGPVLFGVHLFDTDHLPIERDHARIPLPNGDVAPGSTVETRFEIPAPAAPGTYTLEFDLVAERVCWFEINESRTVSIEITVTG